LRSRSFVSDQKKMRRKHPIVSGLLLSLAAITASAQPQSVEQKAEVCAACHGDKGIPVDKSYPVIWGQHQGYLYLELRDFKSGARKNDLMSAIVANLSRDDMMALAEYFSKKTWPDLRQKSAADAEAVIANRVNVSIGCTGCHLGQYQGDATVPRLAGQQHDYLLKSMRDFRSRVRANNPGMTDLMKATAEGDLAPEADFLAGH
jgi:cytochrome c553